MNRNKGGLLIGILVLTLSLGKQAFGEQANPDKGIIQDIRTSGRPPGIAGSEKIAWTVTFRNGLVLNSDPDRRRLVVTFPSGAKSVLEEVHLKLDKGKVVLEDIVRCYVGPGHSEPHYSVRQTIHADGAIQMRSQTTPCGDPNRGYGPSYQFLVDTSGKVTSDSPRVDIRELEDGLYLIGDQVTVPILRRRWLLGSDPEPDQDAKSQAILPPAPSVKVGAEKVQANGIEQKVEEAVANFQKLR